MLMFIIIIAALTFSSVSFFDYAMLYTVLIRFTRLSRFYARCHAMPPFFFAAMPPCLR